MTELTASFTKSGWFIDCPSGKSTAKFNQTFALANLSIRVVRKLVMKACKNESEADR